MKILFVTTGPWGTGSFTVIKLLAKELLQLGHEVKIFFPDTGLESIDKHEYYNNPERYFIWDFPIKNKFHEIPSFPLMIPDPHPRNPNPITFKELSDDQLIFYENELKKKLKSLIQSFKPDIIECHHIWYPSWVVQQIGLNYIVTAHHSDQMGFHFDQRARGKAISTANGAKKIIAISDSVKKEVIDLYNVDPQKVTVIPNGYDKNIFKKIHVNKAEFLNQLGINIPEHASIISFAGKLSHTKGFDILLQANQLLDPAMNIHFIAMGTGDIKDLCKNLNKNSYSLKNIHFVGQQEPERVASIHNISLISVMPSRTEGFGIACLEAMSCGLPMVTSYCGGPENFAVGKIINKESPVQLAQGIMELVNLPPQEYEKLSQQAIQKAEQFSTYAITQQHLNLYQEIL